MTPELPLTTERLLLRDFVKGDWEAVHVYARDPEVVRFMSWGPNTEEDSRNFVAKAIAKQADSPRRDVELALTLREGGILVGACDITVTRPEKRQGCIGYCLNPQYWGQGYATEAARALLAFGFQALGLHRIFATCDTGNGASARVLEKAGMRREGRMRHDDLIRGRWRDSYLYAILEDEWPGGRAGTSA